MIIKTALFSLSATAFALYCKGRLVGILANTTTGPDEQLQNPFIIFLNSFLHSS